MAKTIRILNTQIDVNKAVEIGITHIYGVGRYRGQEIIKELDWESGRRINSLTGAEIIKLRKKLEEKKKKWLLEHELKRDIERRITKEMEKGTYRGMRHQLSLPVRGQRTHSNGKTQRRLMRAHHLISKRKSN